MGADDRDRMAGGEHLPLKPEALSILLCLAEGESHGYEIMKRANAHSLGEVSLQPGSLYRWLKRLLDAGLISERDRPRVLEDDDARRRYYGITEAGIAVARAECSRMAEVVSHAQRLNILERTDLDPADLERAGGE